MAMDYIKIFYDWLEATEDLNYADKGRLVVAMLKYANGEDYSIGDDGKAILTGKAKTLFPTFRKKIDEAAAAYAETINRNRVNGSKGGRPRKPTQTQNNPVGFLGYDEKPTQTQKSQEQEQDKEQDKEQEYMDTTVTTLPSYPRERFNNHWRTSVKARASIAQSLIDELARTFGKCTFSNMHESLCDAMAEGVSPEYILEGVSNCRNWNDLSGWIAWHDVKGEAR